MPITSNVGVDPSGDAGDGVTSIKRNGGSELAGDVTLQAGTNITLVDDGGTNTITINAAGGGITTVQPQVGDGLSGSTVYVNGSGGIAVFHAGPDTLGLFLDPDQVVKSLCVLGETELHHDVALAAGASIALTQDDGEGTITIEATGTVPTPWEADVEPETLGMYDPGPARDTLVLTVPAAASSPGARNVALRGQACTAAVSGDLDVEGGTAAVLGGASTNGAGGAVRVRAGSGAAAGGAALVFGGEATSTAGVGGEAAFGGGWASLSTGTGGLASLTGGYAFTGGGASVAGGQGSSSSGGAGGSALVRAGAGAGGGLAELAGGNSTGSARAGNAVVRGGSAGGNAAGDAVLMGGPSSSSTYSGGNVTLIAGYDGGAAKGGGIEMALATSASTDPANATRFSRTRLVSSTTTSATPSAALTCDVPEHSALVVTSRSFPVKPDGSDGGYVMRQSVYRRNTGSAVLLGAVESLSTTAQENGFSVTHTLSTGTVSVNQVGKATTTISWRHVVQIDVYDIGS